MKILDNKFKAFSAREISPKGWYFEQLLTQLKGLSGNLYKFWPDIKDSKPICYLKPTYGLCFYSCLVFYNGFKKEKSGIVCPKKNGYFNGLLNDYEMNGGVIDFKCEELEIFQLK